jgi:hypothetical protein
MQKEEEEEELKEKSEEEAEAKEEEEGSIEINCGIKKGSESEESSPEQCE